MEKFIGRFDTICYKCGSNYPFVKFLHRFEVEPPQEALLLTCRICRYKWYMKPKDAEEKDGTENKSHM